MGRDHRITDWNPEDAAAWEAGNKRIARRNLLCTIAGDHVAFSIWTLWPVMALFMPAAVYGFSAGDKLLLGAVATLVGGCARIPYTLGIAAFGGRKWTTFSAVVLLIPTVGTIVLLANPGLPLWLFVLCAALTGLGGGNYAASLANVNAFYPQRLKGAAMAVNAGVANLGVAVIQLVGLLVLATAGHQAPYWVCAVYLVFLAAVAIAAAMFMDDINHGTQLSTMRSILFERDTHVISLLYIATFGSWIGFSFAFGQVMQVNFLENGESAKHAALHAAQLAFIGPLLGSVARIYGGRLADRVGGSRVTLGVLAAMTLAAGLLVIVSTVDDQHAGAHSVSMIGYVVGFMVLFVLSGMGNGSVFKLIPSVYEARSRGRDTSEDERRQWARHGGVADRHLLGGRGVRRGGDQPGAAPVLPEHRNRDVGVLDVHGVLRRRRHHDLAGVRAAAGHCARSLAAGNPGRAAVSGLATGAMPQQLLGNATETS